MQFAGDPLEPAGDEYATPQSGIDPPLPRRFRWKARELTVASVLRTWRSSKTDRGDTYLKRHWFEVELDDGTRAQLYFDRAARHGAAKWWLYAIG